MIIVMDFETHHEVYFALITNFCNLFWWLAFETILASYFWLGSLKTYKDTDRPLVVSVKLGQLRPPALNENQATADTRQIRSYVISVSVRLHVRTSPPVLIHLKDS